MSDRIEITPVTGDNVDALVDLAEALLAQAPTFRALPIDRAVMTETAVVLGRVEYAEGYARMAVDKNGQVIGGLLGIASDSFFSRGLIAADMGLFVKPCARKRGAGRALVQDFTRWARDLGCVRVAFGNSAGLNDKAFRRLMASSGLNHAGSLMFANL